MKSVPGEWDALLNDLEKLVIEGRHDLAKNLLQSFSPQQVPRKYAAAVAEIFWRVSEPLSALKILGKIISPENTLMADASSREKFIYATALGHLGAVNEATKIFNSIPSAEEPEVLLRKSFVYFRSWNYATTIPLLQNFVSQENIPPYRRLVGQVNLAAALVTEMQFDSARKWIEEIQGQCHQNNYLLLLGNSYELQAQIHFFQKEFDSAKACLEKANELLESQGGDFSLYTEKWNLLTIAFQKRNDEAITNLRAFQIKALAAGQWETVRECDLFLGLLTEDDELIRKVVFGTPYDDYRQRIRRLSGRNILPHGRFQFSVGETHSAQTFHFDPYTSREGKNSLHRKPQLLALFEALTLDFYKPSHIGLLFQRIHHEEKFNPYTSPKRILTLMKRLNAWFIEQEIPLRVKFKKSEFAIESLENTLVHISIQRGKKLSKQEGHFTNLRKAFKDRTFSAQHLAEHFQISRASAQAILNEAFQEGMLIKQGRGRSTLYALKPRSRRKEAVA